MAISNAALIFLIILAAGAFVVLAWAASFAYNRRESNGPGAMVESVTAYRRDVRIRTQQQISDMLGALGRVQRDASYGGGSGLYSGTGSYGAQSQNWGGHHGGTRYCAGMSGRDTSTAWSGYASGDGGYAGGAGDASDQ